MIVKNARNLYFCKGSTPTSSELAEAKSLGITAFRNVLLIGDEAVEICDAAAGAVPDKYRKIKGIKILIAETSKK